MTWAETIAAAGAGISLLALLVGAGTLWKAIFEYQRQNISKRFEIFQGMNKRFDASEFKILREMLDTDDNRLAYADYTEKHNFLAFFEELALSVNSKIMNDDIAFYMFGYYAIKCLDSKNFWLGDKMIGKDSLYWSLFRRFAERMRDRQSVLVGKDIDHERMKF